MGNWIFVVFVVALAAIVGYAYGKRKTAKQTPSGKGSILDETNSGDSKVREHR